MSLVRVSNEEVLLQVRDKQFFINSQTGQPSRDYDLQWTSVPLSIGVQFPYAIALLIGVTTQQSSSLTPTASSRTPSMSPTTAKSTRFNKKSSISRFMTRNTPANRGNLIEVRLLSSGHLAQTMNVDAAGAIHFDGKGLAPGCVTGDDCIYILQQVAYADQVASLTQSHDYEEALAMFEMSNQHAGDLNVLDHKRLELQLLKMLHMFY